MNNMLEFNAEDFKESLQGAGFLCVDDAGLILLEGESRIDYLQRQTSNDLDQLTKGKAVPNILPDPNGRVIEVFINILWEDGIALLAASNRGSRIIEYFQKRIFFNDRVTLSDKSKEWDQFVLLGDEARERIQAIFAFPSAIEKNEVLAGKYEDQEVFGIGLRDSGDLASILLIVPSSESENIKGEMISREIVEISKLDFERYRILNGIAGAKEYSGNFTPFELGLDEFISNSKGCYTGQEVLARQVTYKKIAKVRATVLADERIEGGDKILFSGQEIGMVSSAVAMPNDKTIGIAIVKKAKIADGNIITIKRGENSVNAEISGFF